MSDIIHHQRIPSIAEVIERQDSIIRAHREEITRLRDELQQAYTFIVHNSEAFNGDWACERCHPNSEILIDGFVCAYHKAKDL